MAPASLPHAAILAELGRLFGNHLLEAGDRCRVYSAPGIVPRIRSQMNHRIPDLGVACSPQTDAYTMTDPILLVEILAPSNEAVTRANVWGYTTIPSVGEILLVRSSRIEAELLRRDAEGHWPSEAQRLGPAASLELASIGFTASLNAIYRTAGLAA